MDQAPGLYTRLLIRRMQVLSLQQDNRHDNSSWWAALLGMVII